MTLEKNRYSAAMDKLHVTPEEREQLLERIRELEDSVDYIDHKQQFYDDVLSGRRPYESNLLPTEP